MIFFALLSHYLSLKKIQKNINCRVVTDYILYQMSHFVKFLSQIFYMHTQADAN